MTKKPTREKKYTIREIFDWIVTNEEMLPIMYKKFVLKDKRIPKGAFPYERFCLVMFEREMNDYDKLKKY